MKLYIHILRIVLLLLVALSGSSTWGASYVVGLSSHYSARDKDPVLQGILLFLLQDAGSGDEIRIFDAVHLHQVASFTIPTEKIYANNPQARAERLKSGIATLRKFLADQESRQGTMASVIHVPEFLSFAGSQLRKQEQEMRIVLIGSPVAISAESAYNLDEAFPSDAHITAHASQSVFSTKDRKHNLAGVTVHYAYLRPAFLNEFHKNRIERFFALYVKEQQGTLVSFAPEVRLAFERARQHLQEPCIVAQLDPADSKVEMRSVAARSVPLWFPTTNTAAVQLQTLEVPQPHVAPVQAIPIPQGVKQGGIGVGIMWLAAGCDFDLYVKATSTSPDLFFGNIASAHGKYYRDYRDRNTHLDYEYVELTSSADIRQVKAFVNFFDGRTPSAIGVAVVHYRGKTYQAPFSLAARMGNKGGDLHRRSQSDYWCELDLLQIVGLSQ